MSLQAVVPLPAARVTESRLSSWGWATAVALVALILRLIGLARPGSIMFDEVYYTSDAHDLLRYGAEQNHKTGGPAFVAHPPLGKWCIAIGEWLFGYDPLGWRIASAFAGAISVLVLVRVGRRLFGSTVLGCVAGLLLALDGLHFVLSRIALLDIFVMLFVLLAFACLLLDRDARRATILDGAPARPWWRLGVGVFLGLALGTKWSALWYVPVFVLLAFVWEARAHHTAGHRRPVRAALRSGGSLTAVVGVMLVVYLATWTGWLVGDHGWGRHAKSNWLASLWFYHREMYHFGVNLDGPPHPAQSTPWSWLTLGRPVAVYADDNGTGCGATVCYSRISMLGTPLLWWSFYPAMIVAAWRWLAARDWRAGAILAGIACAWVPWMFYPHRIMFLFYILPGLPFLVLAVTYALGLILGPPTASLERRAFGATAVALYVLVIALTFVYFYPLLTGGELTGREYLDHLWFDSWGYP